MKLDESSILEALKTVTVKGQEIDLVAAGIISGVIIKDGNIGFSIEIDPSEAAKAAPLKDAAEAAVLALDGVASATAMLTSHRKQHPAQPQQQPAENVMHEPARQIIAVASGKGRVGT